MNHRRFQAAQCLVVTAFGVAAHLPLPARAGEAKPCGEKADAPIAASPEGNPAEPEAVNPAFTTALYQQLRKKEGNVFFSPYSITEAMAMAHAGAKGNTAKEMAVAMHFGDDPKLVQRLQSMRKHISDSVNQDGGQLNIANALCVTGQVPLQSYQTLVREQFDGELLSGGLPEINAWVKEKTQGEIEKILDSLSPFSACVLLNAVYFKGGWEAPFKPSNTGMNYFRTAEGKKVETLLMARRGHYPMASNEEWIAVEMPYKGNSSMVLIMPAKAGQFEAFDEGINEAFLKEVDDQLSDKNSEQKIDLIVPKFKVATEYELVDTMEALGVKDAFNMEKANFDAMYERSDIAIGKIKHKATLEVNEEGSVAAAATAVAPVAGGIPEPAPTVRFDRPFIVRIKENTTNTTLFMGRISDPTK
ncbi:MAG: serpin family protein [Akkermansiaceae bacterium]|nr:serpin family protein [Akkermansiaceae bacterium]